MSFFIDEFGNKQKVLEQLIYNVLVSYDEDIITEELTQYIIDRLDPPFTDEKIRSIVDEYFLQKNNKPNKAINRALLLGTVPLANYIFKNIINNDNKFYYSILKDVDTSLSDDVTSIGERYFLEQHKKNIEERLAELKKFNKLSQKDVFDIFEDRYLKLADDLSITTDTRLKNYIINNIAKNRQNMTGIKAKKLQSLIKKNLSEKNKQNRSRAKTIAETETINIDTFYKKNWGLLSASPNFKWVCTAPLDEPCINSCNTIRQYGLPFPNGLTEPPVHPNCQCILEMVYEYPLNTVAKPIWFGNKNPQVNPIKSSFDY